MCQSELDFSLQALANVQNGRLKSDFGQFFQVLFDDSSIVKSDNGSHGPSDNSFTLPRYSPSETSRG
jgi:hypothetical protein